MYLWCQHYLAWNKARSGTQRGTSHWRSMKISLNTSKTRNHVYRPSENRSKPKWRRSCTNVTSTPVTSITASQDSAYRCRCRPRKPTQVRSQCAWRAECVRRGAIVYAHTARKCTIATTSGSVNDATRYAKRETLL